VNQLAGTFSIPVTLTGSPSISTFASGFFDPSGLAFDASGDLYVANEGSGEVDEVTPGGSVKLIASGLKDPDALAFSAADDGSVYVANVGDNTVVVLTPFGSYTLATGFDEPTALAFDTAGNLYVANAGNGEVDEVTSGGSVKPIASGFNFLSPVALTFDAAGNLYVASTGGDVDKVTPAGTVSTILSGFELPQGLAFDGAGDLYVADGDANALYEMTPGGAVFPFASDFSNPDDLVVNGGNLYVANYAGGTVSKVSQSVSVPFSLGGTAVAGTDFSGVTGSPLEFGIGRTTVDISGTLLADLGAAKSFTITLGPPYGATLANPSVNILTITEPSSLVTIARGGFRYNFSDGLFTQSITITNSSSQAIAAPLALALENLSSNATLINASGTGPYITVLSTGTLARGAAVTVVLEFHDSSTSLPISYQADVFQGLSPSVEPPEMTAAPLFDDDLTVVAIALLSSKQTSG
jgi:sugar lactone lactonase YvrE